jgi:hypothetical protein
MKKKAWTTAELRRLAEDASAHTYSELAVIYGRSRSAIIFAARRYGIIPINARPKWSEQDDSILLSLYGIESIEKILSMLSSDRTENSIRCRVAYLRRNKSTN